MRRWAWSAWSGLLAAAGVLVLSVSAAWAQTGYPPPPTAPFDPGTLPPPRVLPAVSAKVAITGADIARWVVIAAALVFVGTLLVVLYRRRARAES